MCCRRDAGAAACRSSCANSPEPALEPGSVLLRTLYSEVCGTDVHIWHGRLAGVPYPIIPGHVSVGIADKIRGEVRGVDGAQDRRRRSPGLLRRPPDLRPLPRLRCERGRRRAAKRGASTASPIRRARGCSAAGRRRSISSRACRWRRCRTSVPAETYISGGCGLITAVHAIDRAAIMLGDTVLVQGTGAVGLSAIALARLAGATTVIAFGAPADRLELAARDGRRPRRRRAADAAGGADADRARSDRRTRRRCRDRSGRIGARRRRSARSDPRRRPLCDRRALHRRRAERDQRAPADQPQASRDPRLLGQRGLALRARPARARAASCRDPWRAIGARTYALSN